MEITDKNKNLDFLALTELKRLHISRPNENQIVVMKSLLEHTGIITAHLAFHGQLNEQEVACLAWVARGKKSHEISDIIRVKHATVRSHLARLKEKLNVRTLAQAVYEGIRYGYIRPKLIQEK